mmetsp:Transcript_26074/g.61917  ORF Transcript_26074/g.61917 Transcript_26074/m.61917 type:complete len:338 (-) Transcript_26074:964-1977(-)
MVVITATSARARMSSASPPPSPPPLALPMAWNSDPMTRTASARRRRSDMATSASTKSFLHEFLSVRLMSRMLIAHASSRRAGIVSSIFCWARRAVSSSATAPPSAPSSVVFGLSPSPPAAAPSSASLALLSSIAFCAASTSLIAFLPVVAALIPAPISLRLFCAPLLVFFHRAACPPTPRAVFWNPRNSSASTSSAKPMATRKVAPNDESAIFAASCRIDERNASRSPSSRADTYRPTRSRRKSAILTSLLLCLSVISSPVARPAITLAASSSVMPSGICACCSIASLIMVSAVVAIHSSPTYGSTRWLPNMTLKKTRGSISPAISDEPESGLPFLS